MNKKIPSSDIPRQKLNSKSDPQDPYIIGIGASAGGLQALDQLFANIPRDSVAYVIVQHLSAEHKSLLREVLSKHSALRFRDAEHNMALEINNVYVIPAGKQITIKNNRLQVADRVLENAASRTIDTFFKSLAEDKGEKAIGIILSGTGTDGTEGIRELKKAKALVMVQDPDTAKFDGMPRNAINSGYVDFILPPELMPEEIFNYVKVSPLTTHLTDIVADDDVSFMRVLEIVREHSGVDFSNYKRPTIIRRISRRMASCNTNSLVDYLDYINLNPDEAKILGKEFLIGVTKFFRDPEAFEIIANQVIPELVAHKTISEQLRIWVAGCSSGEEAYSLAILVREHLDAVGKELEVKIFASDIDREALEFAGRGLYSEDSLSEVTVKRKKTYFVKEENRYRISQRVRRMVIFAPHNIVNDAPFSKIDLVSCRNMLIYLSPLLQKKVIAKFQYSLQVGGFLFLGSSESIGDHRNFSETDKKWKIYRNNVQARALGAENFGFSGSVRTIEHPKPEFNRDQTSKLQLQHNLAEMLNESILEEFGYAAVYIDENFDMVHGFGEYTRYLALPDRTFTLNILKLVLPELASTLGNMLRRVLRDKTRLTASGILLHEGETHRHVNITARPYLNEKRTGRKLIQLLFRDDTTKELPQTDTQVFWNEAHYEARVNELETELQHAKEDLQSVVEELETANEELQSTNEELLSSNEELQSTNEELQSLNEELHTVNAEHQYKIKVLMELDDDLNNYFRSTDIGQVFVDLDLSIRKFTPASTKQINLIESDIGRSITQISNNLHYDHLIEDIEEAILLRKTQEREVQNRNGNWYQMRVLPYLSQNNRVDGAIIIFIEINELKNLQITQAGILNSSPNAILALQSVRNNIGVVVDFECTLLNDKTAAMLGITEEKLLHKPLSKAYPELLKNGLFDQYLQVISEGHILDCEKSRKLPGKPLSWLHLTAIPLHDGLVLTIQDITHRKEHEKKLLQQQAEITASAERFRNLLEAIPNLTWTNKPSGENDSFNKSWYEYTGLTSQESAGWGWAKAFHPDDVKEKMPLFKQSLVSGNVLNEQARILRQADNQYRWHLVKNVPIRAENGAIILWIGTATDVHDQKLAEEQKAEQRLHQQMEILSTILKTQESERNRISEAIHNGLGQLLYAAKLNLEEMKPENKQNEVAKGTIFNFLTEAITSARNISFELTPNMLQEFGIKSAVEELTSRLSTNRLKLTCDINGFDERPVFLVEISLYRIIQELLNNVLKHSKATMANIELLAEPHQIYLNVQDNGIGCKLEEIKTHKGMGLNSVRNRVDLLQGELKKTSAPGKGTKVEVIIPVKRRN